MSARAVPIPRVYRRAATLALVGFAVVLAALVVNGILSSLLSSPAAPGAGSGAPPDRAACAQELVALEEGLRARVAALLVAAPRDPAPEGLEVVAPTEAGLRAFEDRCGLREGPRGRHGRALRRAVDALRAEMGATRLVWDRYRDGSRAHARDFAEAMEQVRRRLEER